MVTTMVNKSSLVSNLYMVAENEGGRMLRIVNDREG